LAEGGHLHNSATSYAAPPTSKNVANWFPGPLRVQILFTFLQSPQGSTGVASFKSNLPAQVDFFGNFPRPPQAAK
jgi:hypothetical protein